LFGAGRVATFPELGDILQLEIHRLTGGEQFCDTLDR